MSLKPYYIDINPITGRALFAVDRDDYEKARQGYACPHCLEDYQGMYLIKCPVCNHQTDFGGGDFVPVIPQHMVPEDMSLLHDPEESDYFDRVKNA